MGVGRSILKAKLSTVFVVDVKPLGIRLTLTVLHLGQGKAWGGVVKVIGRSKFWLNEGKTATGTMAGCALTSHYTTMQQLK